MLLITPAADSTEDCAAERNLVGECLRWGHIRHLRVYGFHSAHPRSVPSSSLAGRTVSTRCAGSFAPGLLAAQADLLALFYALRMRGVRWTRLLVDGYLLWFDGLIQPLLRLGCPLLTPVFVIRSDGVSRLSRTG
jgi:hypothetical protein